MDKLRERVYHLTQACSLNDGHNCEYEALLQKHDYGNLLANREAHEIIMKLIAQHAVEVLEWVKANGCKDTKLDHHNPRVNDLIEIANMTNKDWHKAIDNKIKEIKGE